MEDLDRPQRRARVVSKGSNTDLVCWVSATARLLVSYLAGRSCRTPTQLPHRCAAFGRHSGGWTLHRLRHSSLTHLAEGGASAVMLQAKTRHRDIRTLSVYTRPGLEAVARLTGNQFDRR